MAIYHLEYLSLYIIGILIWYNIPTGIHWGYMVIFTMNLPPMLAYIPYDWIRHGIYHQLAIVFLGVKQTTLDFDQPMGI